MFIDELVIRRKQKKSNVKVKLVKNGVGQKLRRRVKIGKKI